jgi:hypothetical protein
MSKIKAVQGIAKFFGFGAKAAKVNKTKKVIKLSKKILDQSKTSAQIKKIKSGTGTQTGKNTVEWNIPPVKKPPVKAPAIKKPIVKKPAVKKPAVKKPIVKAPVKKAPVKKVTPKPAIKKPAVKAPVKAPIVKKPVVKKPPVKKPPVKKPPVKKPPVPTPIKDNSYSGTNLDTRAGKVASYAGKKADAIGKGVAGVIKAPVKGARYIYRNPKKAIVPAIIAGIVANTYNQNRKYNAMLKTVEGRNKKTGPKTIFDKDLYKSDTTGKAAYDLKKKALKTRNSSPVDSTAYKKAQAHLDSLVLLQNKKNK